jgi:predicted Zn-dependent protease
VAYHEAGEGAASEEYARRAGLRWPIPPGTVLDDPLARPRAAPVSAAGQEARRLVGETRYDEAIALLDAEVRRRGGDALTFQFLSNVYYLKGDLARAREAVAEASRREPDNLLYRRNLEALEQQLRAAGGPARAR